MENWMNPKILSLKNSMTMFNFNNLNNDAKASFKTIKLDVSIICVNTTAQERYFYTTIL